MDELRKCPFCGGEAECNKWWSATISGKYATFCKKCTCGTDYFDTEAEAIAAWNARAERKPTDAVREFAERYERRIAELEAELESARAERTCSIEEKHGDWYCTECGDMVGTCDTASELFIDGNAIELWNYCPNCGRRVIA